MRHKSYKFPSTILIRPLIKTCKSSCQRRFLEYIISPCNYRVCLQNIRGVGRGSSQFIKNCVIYTNLKRNVMQEDEGWWCGGWLVGTIYSE